jgi:DNA-binding transcriptional regulator GbsR (MarR family)
MHHEPTERKKIGGSSMSEETEGMNFIEQTVQRQQREIDDTKSDIKQIKGEIGELKTTTKMHDVSIDNITTTLDDIKEDTKWLRRTITKAFISTLITGLIGGVIALFFTTI